MRFSIGGISRDWSVRGRGDPPSSLQVSYQSWPLNPEGMKSRLVLSRTQSDFFSGDGEAGVRASHRLKGIVLHDILSRVSVPSDLEAAVRQSVLDGSLGEDEAAGALSFLSQRLASASARGWFSENSLVRNETDIIDTDGSVSRPDRVEICSDGKVRILDYKFGRQDEEYGKQIARYADLYRKMGYSEVYAAVWYVVPDILQEI